MVFVAHDVGDRNPAIVGFFDQSDRDARDRIDDRDARRHETEGAAADGRHRARTVRFENIGNDAHRIGERFRVGHDGLQAAFSERAMAIFASADAAVRLAFADGVGREVVIEHEALRGFGEESFDSLLVLGRSERDRNERLRFAALEERGTVDARQHVNAAFDRANFFDAATVESRAGKDNVADDARRSS